MGDAMFGGALLWVGAAFAALVVFLLAVLAAASATTGTTRVSDSWRVMMARATGLVTGLVAAAVLATSDADVLALGKGLMLAPVALGVCLLLGVIVGETVARPAAPGAVRTADLTPRRVLDHVPRGLTIMVCGLLAISAATLTFTSVTASADDLGRAGRVLTRSCTADRSVDVVDIASRGPYPGAYYSVPLAIGMLLMLALAAVALRRVVLRPRGSTSRVEDDDVLRRRSATAVVAALGVAVAAPLIGIAGTAASTIGGFDCPAAGWRVVSLLLLGVVGAALLTLFWCLTALAAPATGLQRRSPSSAR